MSDRYKTKSKFLSLVLRHEPGLIGLTLDEAGWASVDDVLRGCLRKGHSITPEELKEIVRTSDKQRFALSADGRRIRANQGHSVEVELGHAEAEPPEVLYHGTGAQWIDAIRRDGLKKMQRHHVHLSATVGPTMLVAQRKGEPALLTVRAGDMRRDGHVFYRTPNDVWLVGAVPPRYLIFPDAGNGAAHKSDSAAGDAPQAQEGD